MNAKHSRLFPKLTAMHLDEMLTSAVESCHGTSMRSNASLVSLSCCLTVKETSQTLHKTDRPRHSLKSLDLRAINQRAETGQHQRTQDWVHSCRSSSYIWGHAQERRDAINKHLRVVDELARELDGVKIEEEKSKRDEAVNNEPKCQNFQFIGGWTNKEDEQH